MASRGLTRPAIRTTGDPYLYRLIPSTKSIFNIHSRGVNSSTKAARGLRAFLEQQDTLSQQQIDETVDTVRTSLKGDNTLQSLRKFLIARTTLSTAQIYELLEAVRKSHRDDAGHLQVDERSGAGDRREEPRRQIASLLSDLSRRYGAQGSDCSASSVGSGMEEKFQRLEQKLNRIEEKMNTYAHVAPSMAFDMEEKIGILDQRLKGMEEEITAYMHLKQTQTNDGGRNGSKCGCSKGLPPEAIWFVWFLLFLIAWLFHDCRHKKKEIPKEDRCPRSNVWCSVM